MKNIIIITLFLCSYLITAQSISFSSITSNNVLSFINSTRQNENDSSSKTAVVQMGNNNKASIYDKSKKSDLMIRQTGNFNTTLMTNINPELENKQKVNVEGSNNYIDVTGNNGNSKEMQINLKTNDKMIFVRHF